MEFRFTVYASVDRTEGKFSTRDDISGQLQEALEGADPGTITGENEGTYEVSDWTVEEEPLTRAKAAAPARPVTQSAGPPLAPNLVRIISAYLRVSEGSETDETAIDDLLAELDILVGRFPKIAEQERAKLKGS